MTRTDPRGSTALFLYRKPDTAMVVPALELAGPPAEAPHEVKRICHPDSGPALNP